MIMINVDLEKKGTGNKDFNKVDIWDDVHSPDDCLYSICNRTTSGRTLRLLLFGGCK